LNMLTRGRFWSTKETMKPKMSNSCIDGEVITNKRCGRQEDRNLAQSPTKQVLHNQTKKSSRRMWFKTKMKLRLVWYKNYSFQIKVWQARKNKVIKHMRGLSRMVTISVTRRRKVNSSLFKMSKKQLWLKLQFKKKLLRKRNKTCLWLQLYSLQLKHISLRESMFLLSRKQEKHNGVLSSRLNRPVK